MPHVEIQTCIRGFHFYKEVWTPVMEEILICSRENTNLHHVSKSEMIVGHLQRSISLVCSLFFKERSINIIVKEPWVFGRHKHLFFF